MANSILQFIISLFTSIFTLLSGFIPGSSDPGPAPTTTIQPAPTTSTTSEPSKAPQPSETSTSPDAPAPTTTSEGEPTGSSSASQTTEPAPTKAPVPSKSPAPTKEPAPAPTKTPAPGDSGSSTQKALIDATNRFREKNGLPALKPMPALNDLAQDWSEQMARAGQISHRPNFANHYPKGWKHASENVLQNMTSAQADALVQQWANSPGHRANMLDTKINCIGVGIADTNGKRYATQNFARY